MPDLEPLLRAHVVDVPDFPSPGVVFKDISPLLASAEVFRAAVEALAAAGPDVDVVVGVEARGFLLGAPVALALGAAFVPARKPGKLPRAVLEARYELEYGSDVLQVHADALAPGNRVLVVDDVLATGGTAAAAVELVRAAGAVPAGVAVLLELTALGGRALLAAAEPDVPVTALLPV